MFWISWGGYKIIKMIKQYGAAEEDFLHGNYATCLLLPRYLGINNMLVASVQGVSTSFHIIPPCSLTHQPVQLLQATQTFPPLLSLSLSTRWAHNSLTPDLPTTSKTSQSDFFEIKIFAIFRRHGNVNRRGSSLMEMEGFTGKEPTTMARDSDSYRCHWWSFNAYGNVDFTAYLTICPYLSLFL